MTRAEEIVERLRSALDAAHVEIEDESHRHADHPGARGGGGHRNVLVVAECFAGQDRIARQRAVHRALGDLFGGAIHALSIRTMTPDEWARRARAS